MIQLTHSAPLDAMFDMLGNSHRRRILLAVSDHNPRNEDEFTPDTFAPDDADADELDQLQLELFHVHLPQLADNGYVEWDRDSQTIRRGPNFDDIAPLLELLVEHEDELPADWP